MSQVVPKSVGLGLHEILHGSVERSMLRNGHGRQCLTTRTAQVHRIRVVAIRSLLRFSVFCGESVTIQSPTFSLKDLNGRRVVLHKRIVMLV